MQYMIITYENSEAFDARTGPNKEEYWGAWRAYSTALSESGVLRGGNALQPPHTSTTVKMAGGKRLIQDGPFADSKEQLGGYYIIDVDNLDKALEWAARCPAVATGGVEVRPVLKM
jgi:hypothetical protein